MFFCDFDNAPLGEVFGVFSAYSGKQFVASSEVQGGVTAKMSDVEWQDAFDAIVHINGWTYDEHGQFVYVYTKTEWDAMQAAVAAHDENFDDDWADGENADAFSDESFENAENADSSDAFSAENSDENWAESNSGNDSDSSNEAGAFAAGAAAGAAAGEVADSFSGNSNDAGEFGDAASDNESFEADSFNGDANGDFGAEDASQQDGAEQAFMTPEGFEAVVAEDARRRSVRPAPRRWFRSSARAGTVSAASLSPRTGGTGG